MNPNVLLSPAAGDALFRGFDRLAELLACTLGPTRGHALSESLTSRSNRPEIVDDAAVIARRMMQFPDRGEDVGAMLLRQLVWRVHQRVGDGSATAAVIAQAVLRAGRRLAAGGAGVMALRTGMEKALSVVRTSLHAQARPVRDYGDLIRIALTATGEENLSVALGEMFHNLGADAHIDVEEYIAPYIERDYHEGGRWKARIASAYLYTDPAAHKADVHKAMVALFAGDVERVDQIAPLLRLASALAPEGDQVPAIAVFAHETRGEALATLITNAQQKRLRAVAVDLRRAGAEREADFADLATITGARVFDPVAGDALEALTERDIGFAARVLASPTDAIVAGEGREAARDAAIRTLRRKAGNKALDESARDDARFRIARLIGQLGTLKIGAHTEAERASLRLKADKGLRILPRALEQGWVPGGGVALLVAADAVRAAAETYPDREHAWGARALAEALEAPFNRLLSNARLEPAPLAATLRAKRARRGGGLWGYDLVAGELRNMPEAGVLEAAGVLEDVVAAAVSGALMALTTEVTVLRADPPTMTEP